MKIYITPTHFMGYMFGRLSNRSICLLLFFCLFVLFCSVRLMAGDGQMNRKEIIWWWKTFCGGQSLIEKKKQRNKGKKRKRFTLTSNPNAWHQWKQISYSRHYFCLLLSDKNRMISSIWECWYCWKLLLFVG